MESIKYSIFDPTGNITALVESEVEISRQPGVASEIMKLHPEVEQVGYVSFDPSDDVPVRLRMAGGEFCGNATLSAAALYFERIPEAGRDGDEITAKVSGADSLLKVRFRSVSGEQIAEVLMPQAKSIDAIRLAAEEVPGSEQTELPLVRMEGIDHIIISRDSSFYTVKNDRELAESIIRRFCDLIASDCLGLMFLGDGTAERELTPLVYVPGADTMFWENSCASGTTAAGMYLAYRDKKAVDLTFVEPGGRLRVASDPESGETRLIGSAKLVRTAAAEIDTDNV